MLTDPLDNTADRRKAAAALGPVILYGHPSLAEVAEARGRAGSRGILIVPEELLTPEEMRERLLTDDGQEIDMDQPAPDLDPEQHFGHEPTRLESLHVARNILRERGLQLDFDNLTALIEEADSEIPESVLAEDYVTMAEEPIEQRLRRAFLNGFKEGVDRASNVIEGWGRWDA